MSELKTAVIIGSTRDARFGPKPGQQIFDVARQREERDVELLDLKSVRSAVVLYLRRGYGSVGAARAIEHLRLINIELQMVLVRSAAHIGTSEFFKVFRRGQNLAMSAIEEAILLSAKDMLSQLIWWGRATKAARQEKVTA
jgi:NAD(P)H-dependent FMN reductase